MFDRRSIEVAAIASANERRNQILSGSSGSGLASSGDWLKRSFDVSVSAFLLLVLLPVFLLICVALATQGGPVLFRHRRLGRHAREFPCLKFRTMAIDADAVLQKYLSTDVEAQAEWKASQKLKCDPRVTPLGKVLRKTSIDELPQLINVLRGDMSLVGPRPIVQAEVHHYGEHIRSYYEVRPGLTGAWQVSGRSDISYDSRVALDRDYIAHRNLARDLSILLRTVPAVLKSKGSY